MACILVIDDDLQLRRFLCTLLGRNNRYEVHEAANGKDGVALLRNMPVDLVVTDIFMPGEDGLGTIMEICKNYPKTKIIAISGGGNVKNVDFLELASCLGAQKLFQKPFDNKVFLATVEEMLL
jgi:DNA-binding NtrC family response regulator